MPAPTKTTTPTRVKPGIEPRTHYNPERLCPGQRDDGERKSRP